MPRRVPLPLGALSQRRADSGVPGPPGKLFTYKAEPKKTDNRTLCTGRQCCPRQKGRHAHVQVANRMEGKAGEEKGTMHQYVEGKLFPKPKSTSQMVDHIVTLRANVIYFTTVLGSPQLRRARGPWVRAHGTPSAAQGPQPLCRFHPRGEDAPGGGRWAKSHTQVGMGRPPRMGTTATFGAGNLNARPSRQSFPAFQTASLRACPGRFECTHR